MSSPSTLKTAPPAKSSPSKEVHAEPPSRLAGANAHKLSDVGIALRGLIMGVTDVIPGVSGGTMALILGIYDRLVTAISHVDAIFMGHLRNREWSQAARHLDLRFLVMLLLGIFTGISALLGSVINHLLLHERQFTYAAFFGLIVASSVLVARMVHRWSPLEWGLLIAGGVFAYWLVRLPALTNPPDGLWYVFVSGVIGICAMILPGISGAFLLLILGKYEDLTGIIKETLQLHMTFENVATVVVFGAGCAIGLVSFSKFLRRPLARHEAQTMSTLCGFMIGSLYKLWPFQADVTPNEVEFKHKAFEHIAPADLVVDGQFWLTLAIGLGEGIVVLVIDYVSRISEKPPLAETEQPIVP